MIVDFLGNPKNWTITHNPIKNYTIFVRSLKPPINYDFLYGDYMRVFFWRGSKNLVDE